MIKAVEVYLSDCEIIIVDNGSSDGSVEYIKANFSQAKIISLRENSGFAPAMNIGIKEASGRIVIGLNNDVVVREDFISSLVGHFQRDETVFTVAAKMLLLDGRTLNFGRAVGKFKFGVFKRSYEEPGEAVTALYACGGAFAADRDKFLKLGGFDEDMIGYWEDLDICYRAWKQGYKTIYEPRSVVYHKLHGTYAKRYGEKGIRLISGENYMLFVLKNFHDKTLFYQQMLSLPLLIGITPLLGEFYFGLGLLRSFKKFPLFLRKRREEKQKAIFSDREVLAMSNQ